GGARRGALRRRAGFSGRPADGGRRDHRAAPPAEQRRAGRRGQSRADRLDLRALVLGADGQLGTELVRLLGPESAVPHAGVSITDARAVEALIEGRRPEVVFNCAAYNAVDRAESERDAAYAINAEGPRIVAAACRSNDAWCVHFSTNFVFDGAGAEPYVESDVPAPLSIYASSKLAGGENGLQEGAHVLVVRTAAVFGTTTGRSFPERVVQRARAGERLRIVSD